MIIEDGVLESVSPGDIENGAIVIFSREKAEAILQGDFLNKTTIISFCDPVTSSRDNDYTPIDFSGKAKRYICVELEDIDIDELEERGLTYEHYFPEAEKVADLLLNAYGSWHKIIFQCEHGQSRSAGCAAAYCEAFYHSAITIFADYRYYPNRLIYHKMLDALRMKWGSK